MLLVNNNGFLIPDSRIYCTNAIPDSKFHGVNMGPIWGRQDPGGSHVGPMNFAIWELHLTLPKKLDMII